MGRRNLDRQADGDGGVMKSGSRRAACLFQLLPQRESAEYSGEFSESALRWRGYERGKAMSRIEEAFQILRSIERCEPQPTASCREAEREYWERRAAQAGSPAEIEHLRRLYSSRPRGALTYNAAHEWQAKEERSDD